ncbi:MAG: EAL domain-containing protein [Planctomycetaceae bacterium]|nr:EAL domain-containing protein [Planctomycetales bacterium]MCB9875905.1 EAL domain-containing protein [Planctomycetaceae bacterium]MCB9937607.1 EAL domain-containing protein [Planctomycetaceae bacterium]
MPLLAPPHSIPHTCVPSAALWFLVGHLNPTGHNGEQVHIPINAKNFSVGRRPDSSLCLPFRTVSSNHAEFVSDHGKLILRDLGSTNGTYVNGNRLYGETELNQDDIVQFADVALRLQRQSSAVTSATLQEDVYDQALALVQFDKLMNERQVTPYYQPIVDFASGETIAYEVLGRSRLYGIETPGAMFRAAAKLNLEVQLSNMLRWEGVLQSSCFATPPHLFVNTHPRELNEDGLIEAMRAVRETRPLQPLTLEIHEGAVTNVKQMFEIREALADLDVRLAFDDFGAGQARLVELVNVKPDYLKFDIALIRDLDQASPQKQQMISSLVRMVRDIGIVPLAEGIEREEESQVCRDLGFDLGQGYFYGKPAPGTCF